MKAARLQELEKMGEELQATARKLPPGITRQNMLHEIGRLRARVVALQSDLPKERQEMQAKGGGG
jgi:hypothetical protein